MVQAADDGSIFQGPDMYLLSLTFEGQHLEQSLLIYVSRFVGFQDDGDALL